MSIKDSFHDDLFVLLTKIFLFVWRIYAQFDETLANEMICGLARDIEVEKQQKKYRKIMRI
jgi:hypothetical protein